MRLLALRGAVTCAENTSDEVHAQTGRLVNEMLTRNDLTDDDLVSLIFTATDDITAEFPAAAARAVGLGHVPLICARELAIDGAVERCIRVMMHCYSPRTREQLHHVYLDGARVLRDDLPE